MERKLVSRFFIILFILVFAGLLLYPTLGPKTMEVEFAPTISQKKLQKIMERYRKEGYEVHLQYQKDEKMVSSEPGRAVTKDKGDKSPKTKQKKPDKTEPKDGKQEKSNLEEESAGKEKRIPVLTFHSFKITLALANALRVYPEVEDITIQKTWMEERLMANPIKLGLDLQGGMRLLLQANYQDIIDKLKKEKKNEWLREKYGKDMKPSQPGAGPSREDILVLEPGVTEEQKQKAIENWRKQQSQKQASKKDAEQGTDTDPKSPSKGLSKGKGKKQSTSPNAQAAMVEDYQGQKPIVLQLQEDRVTKAKKKVIFQARDILSKRINETGVSEPSIRVMGQDSIDIELPGVPDPKQAKTIIGSTGQVTYQLVHEEATQKLMQRLDLENIPNHTLTSKEYDRLRQETKALLDQKKTKEGVPLEVIYLFKKNKQGKYIPDQPYVFESTVELQGDAIDRAWVGNTQTSINAVNFRLTAQGAEKFAQLTDENKGRHMGIIIDDQLYSSPPVIKRKIAGGQAYIEGSFNKDEAESLASIINEGALPVKLAIIEERTVGPSLGVESIESGMTAIILSLALVIVIIIFRYKMSGAIASFGLGANFVVLGALLSWLGFTLTLPGIAGLILTLGMAIDANVIIFERIREELRAGKTVRSAIANGYDKAFSTVFDANATTLLAALVLSQLGTGPIKGFAVTLSVGIVSSLFTALYVSRFIFDLISQKRVLKKLSI